MKTAIQAQCDDARQPWRSGWWMAVILFVQLVATPVRAQLAITEAMAYAALIPGQTVARPDFWELTNLGDEAVNLDGYWFRDNNPGEKQWEPFAGVSIRGGETIILCRTNNNLRTTADFVAWWGASQLPADLQVLPYFRPGFDEILGDEVWLMNPFDEVVDMVSFGESVRGRTKAYDPVTGEFDRNSVLGLGGAFAAEQNPLDIGSPGWTAGRVPLNIVTQPASQTIDCCGAVTFSVRAGGLPRPTYQWTSNNIPIPGANSTSLTLPAVTPQSGGAFRVVLEAGGVQVVSQPAILTVNTTPTRPSFLEALQDDALFPGQTIRLAPVIRGYPVPHCQWLSNGVAIPGANSPQFTLVTTTDTPLGSALYTLVLSNNVGRAESSARLTVMRRPKLQITEVMPEPTNSTALPPPGLKAWFEVTNTDTNAVNLRGYRFRDSASFERASVITSNVVIRPGESILFVDSMSAESFIRWWGDDRLPLNLQVLTWLGWSLSSRADDIIYLWNAHAVDQNDIVANTSYNVARPGFSQEPQIYCDDFGGCVGWDPLDSLEGINGAFVSLMATNIGSPGLIDFPDPYFTRVTRTGNSLQFRCRFAPRRRYQLHSRDRFSAGTLWTGVQTVTATNIVMTLTVPLPPGATRFYRLEELP